MDFRITCDANIESGLDELLNSLNDDGFETYFEDKFYDDSGISIFVILMSRDSRWNFNQRIRFSKRENCLYTDIMLDLDVMSHADSATRKRIVGEKIVNEVPEIIARKRFKDFDLSRFTSDLREWFEVNGWISAEFFPEFIE